jgi:glutamate-5-semialdehyde dehydrogenase
MENLHAFKVGDRFIVGDKVIVLDEQFHESLREGDSVLAVGGTSSLKRIPFEVQLLVDQSVSDAVTAFAQLSSVSVDDISRFYEIAANRLADDAVFSQISKANKEDVSDAQVRGRSTTRLVLSETMRSDMVSAFRMWQELDMQPLRKIDEIHHDGWSVEQWRSPLGVIGFVFEGRPNVFADATGVLKSGNTVVFRIGSDALRTAEAIMQWVITPALLGSELPLGSVQLISSREHAAGWQLFSDRRIALAVARGSGEAVAELGSIAQQSGVPVSLHGTGGAWMIIGESADANSVSKFVEHSLDRKVCNTANVICVPAATAHAIVPVVFQSAMTAAQKRGTSARIHAVNGAERYLDMSVAIDVHRADGVKSEPQVSTASERDLAHEFEWEENPEFFLVLTDSTDHAVRLFNSHSPQFVVSAVSQNEQEIEHIWNTCNSPFFGDGFTRWVDGQFALLRPELGLSNWQNGRLFSRSGILSGDSAFTVRLRVRQQNSDLHR